MSAEKSRLPIYFHSGSDLDCLLLKKINESDFSKSDQMKKMALAGAILDDEGVLDVFISATKSKGLKRALMACTAFIDDEPLNASLAPSSHDISPQNTQPYAPTVAASNPVQASQSAPLSANTNQVQNKPDTSSKIKSSLFKSQNSRQFEPQD